jgi:uncharacterized protein YbjQ (UPF0145 family)
MLDPSLFASHDWASPESHGTEATDPEVELYAGAWVPGTRAEAYFGPISSEIFLRDAEVMDRVGEWTEAQLDLLELLRERARLKHANAVIGVEMNLDPFARCPRSGAIGLHLYAMGTAARLERI